MVQLVEIGYIARAHGIRGEVRVVVHNPASTVLTQVDWVYIGSTRMAIRSARPVQGAFLICLVDVTDRNRAESLRGSTVSVERGDLDLGEDDVLLADFVGCTVVLADGSPYGTVVAVEPGAQDRLVIHDNDIERLLPLVSEFIESIDWDTATIVACPPFGLPETRRSG